MPSSRKSVPALAVLALATCLCLAGCAEDASRPYCPLDYCLACYDWCIANTPDENCSWFRNECAEKVDSGVGLMRPPIHPAPKARYGED